MQKCKEKGAQPLNTLSAGFHNCCRARALWCALSLILKYAVCLWQLISSMTFESIRPQGNRKGYFTSICSQLPIHASQQWHRKINRESTWKSTKYFTGGKCRIIRRLSGVFQGRKVMVTGLCSRRFSYVSPSWACILKDFILGKWNLKAFKYLSISEMYPLPRVIINISANSFFCP